jgi:hypothetical protein
MCHRSANSCDVTMLSVSDLQCTNKDSSCSTIIICLSLFTKYFFKVHLYPKKCEQIHFTISQCIWEEFSNQHLILDSTKDILNEPYYPYAYIFLNILLVNIKLLFVQKKSADKNITLCLLIVFFCLPRIRIIQMRLFGCPRGDSSIEGSVFQKKSSVLCFP